MGMKVEVERPIRVLPRDQVGHAERQRRLSHARHALDHDDSGDVAALTGEQPEFLVASHEFGRLGRKGVWRCGPAGAPAGGRDGQAGVTAQNALMQLGQHRPRLCALLINEAAAGFPVEAECVGRSAAPVKGGHLVGDKRFIQWVLSQQMAKLAYQVSVATKLQLTPDTLHNGRPALLFETVPHPLYPVASYPNDTPTTEIHTLSLHEQDVPEGARR